MDASTIPGAIDEISSIQQLEESEDESDQLTRKLRELSICGAEDLASWSRKIRFDLIMALVGMTEAGVVRAPGSREADECAIFIARLRDRLNAESGLKVTVLKGRHDPWERNLVHGQMARELVARKNQEIRGSDAVRLVFRVWIELRKELDEFYVRQVLQEEHDTNGLGELSNDEKGILAMYKCRDVAGLFESAIWPRIIWGMGEQTLRGEYPGLAQAAETMKDRRFMAAVKKLCLDAWRKIAEAELK